MFCFAAGNERIPEWFENQTRELSISFWFRNTLASIVFFFSSKKMNDSGLLKKDLVLRVYLLIDDDIYTLVDSELGKRFMIRSDHTYIFSLDMQYWLESQCTQYCTPKVHQELKSLLDDKLLKNEWIHAQGKFENVAEYKDEDEDEYEDGDEDEDEEDDEDEDKNDDEEEYDDEDKDEDEDEDEDEDDDEDGDEDEDEDILESGIHVLRPKTNMDDIQFIDPSLDSTTSEKTNTGGSGSFWT